MNMLFYSWLLFVNEYISKTITTVRIRNISIALIDLVPLATRPYFPFLSLNNH